MTRFASALVGALLLGVLGAAASPAVADTSSDFAATAAKQGTVTKAEFRRVKKNMKRERVAQIFDTDGRQTWYSSACCGGIPAAQTRSYKPAYRYSSVNIDYERINGVWRVTAKRAYWG